MSKVKYREIAKQKFFPVHFIIIGCIFILSGIMSIIVNYTDVLICLFAAAIIMVGVFFATSTVTLQVKDNKYRNAFAFLGLSFGTWYAVNLPYVTVLKKRLRTRVYGGRTNISRRELKYEYSVTLLSESHKSKKPIISFTNQEKALDVMHAFSSYFNCKVTKYNPQ